MDYKALAKELAEQEYVGIANVFRAKGVTLAALNAAKNTATNRLQELREPYKNVRVYKETLRPVTFDKEIVLPAFIPDTTNLEEQLVVEGKLGAFAAWATKVMQFHATIKDAFATHPIKLSYDDEPFADEERLLELTRQANLLQIEKPHWVEQTMPQKQLEQWATPDQYIQYLLADQKASAMGNVILASPLNSRNPRNFLYTILDSSYRSFVERDTLYETVLNEAERKRFSTLFYRIQTAHREQEEAKNAIIAQYKQGVAKEHDAFITERQQALDEHRLKQLVWQGVYNTLTTEQSMLQTNRTEHLAQQRIQRELHERAVREELLAYHNTRKVWLPEGVRPLYDMVATK